jgi:hypothetical protein
MNHKPGPSLSISEIEVRKILTAVWEAVARTNPMLLAKLRADYDFNSLKAMIRDCLEKGMSVEDVCSHVVKELVSTATANRQPHDKCDAQSRPEQQPA